MNMFKVVRRGEGHRETAIGDGPRVHYSIDESGDFTVVTLVGKRFAASGAAKRNPRDPLDRQVGVDIASARALRDLADQVEKSAGRRQ
jgi:hypothetical protein